LEILLEFGDLFLPTLKTVVAFSIFGNRIQKSLKKSRKNRRKVRNGFQVRKRKNGENSEKVENVEKSRGPMSSGNKIL
jgi:hypothetical protein